MSVRNNNAGESIGLGRRDPLYVKTPEWILVSGISPQAQALYSMLRAHVNRGREDNVSWPGLELLAEMLGYRKKHSVIKYVRELQKLGAVDVTKVPCAVGLRNHYVVHESPPAGYTGYRNLNELHDVYRARKKSEREARDAAARSHFIGGNAAGAALPDAPVAAEGDAAGAAQNQRNSTRRIEPQIYASGEDAHAVAHEQARVRESERPKRSTTSKPPTVHIITPPPFVEMTDGEMTRDLVAAAAAAMTKAGQPLGLGGRDKLGRWLTDLVDLPVDVRAKQLKAVLDSALAGAEDCQWVFQASTRERGYENTAEGFDQLEDDLTSVPGGVATIFSMAGKYHPNAIANTAKKRGADA